MKKQIGNEQIEREQVISYKKKNEHKPVHKPFKQDEEDFQSATSLKSNVFSEDSVKFNKKNTPLPQLNKERRKIFARGLTYNQNKPTPSFQQKQVRQHDNLVLKQQNNHLTTENMKLKTKLMTLEKQNVRLQKILEDDSSRIKPSVASISGKQARFTKLNPESSSMKMLIRSLKKELEQVKKENTKIKWSIKFTRINELQIQRQNILEETTRLRAMVQQELGKRVNMKIKQHGQSNLQHKVISLQQKNSYLAKQKLDLQNKLKKIQQTGKSVQKISQNEKNLNKMLFNARRVIKEKQKQIEEIKSQQSSNSNGNIQSLNSIPGSQKHTQLNVVQSSKQTSAPASKKELSKRINSKEKRVMSKSAQKYRANAAKTSEDCESCKRLSDQNNVLLRKIEQLANQIKAQKEKNSKKGFGELSKEPIERPTTQAIETIGRFLSYRFKAHHLSLQEAQKYLVSNQTAPVTQNEMSISEIVESLVAEPFSIISNTYLESMITGLFYANENGKKIKFDQNKKMKKENIIANFRKIVKPYELMSQAKQEEMFIQIAQLVTNYHQHILTALNGKRNGEGTITEQDLTFFFNEIELQKEYVDFIIIQIILESYDLVHLNYYAMFQIFYMPTQQISEGNAQLLPNKKKFQVDQFNVVKQQDQQYEQSRSHVDAKQKTQSRRGQDQDSYDQQQEKQAKKKTHSISNAPRTNLAEKLNASNIESNIEEQNQTGQMQGNNESALNKKVSQEYEEQFQQEKIEVAEQQDKTNEHKPYAMQEELEDYKDEFEG